jgi:outer membrane protein
MKKILIAALLLTIAPASRSAALTIDEAVRLALANNHRIKEAQHLEQSALARVGTSQSNFFPSLDLGYDYRRGEHSILNLGKETSAFTVGLSYNIFRGKSDTHELASERARAEGAAYRLRSVEADIALAVRWAFIDTLRAARTVDTAKESVRLLEEQRGDAERFFQQGLSAKNDLLRVEVELSSARQDLLRSEGDHRLARRSLARLLGSSLPGDEPLETFEELPELTDLSFPDLRAEMLRNRSELKYLRSLQRALEESREGRRGPYWPRVDVILAHDNFGDTLFPDGQEGGFDSDTSAALNATWNLYNGKRTKHQVEEADELAKANAEALRDTEAELALQLETALERYGVARGNTETARLAVEQAEENYRVNESLYKARLGTATDFVDARFLLTRSRNEHTLALAEIFKAVTGLERVLERPGDGSVTGPAEGAEGRPGGEKSSPPAP